MVLTGAGNGHPCTLAAYETRGAHHEDVTHCYRCAPDIGGVYASRRSRVVPLMEPIRIQPIGEGDRDWVTRTIVQRWGSEVVVGHGTVYQPARLPGFIAWSGNVQVGLLTYHLEDTACEIVTIDTFGDRRGAGTALIEATVDLARAAGCRRLWLITTNDNLRALRFYQKRGFHLTRLYPDAVTTARRIKPEIPLVGEDGIPLRDELELEMPLG